MRAWRRFSFFLLALAAIFSVYASLELQRYPVNRFAAAAVFVSLIFLFALYLAPGTPGSCDWVHKQTRSVARACGWMDIFLAPYLIYSAGTGDFRWPALGKLAAFVVVPFGLFSAVPVRRPKGINWQDVVVLLWLFLPVVFGRLGGIWNVPVNLDFMTRVYLVGIGSWAFLIIRHPAVEQAGYEFRMSALLLRDALISFAGFAVIALPLGLAMHFLAVRPQWRGLPQFGLDYLTIFLFVAIPEELFFRGLLQNLLEGSVGSRWLAQGAASILFGLTHILHAPFPNWKYVLLATIAGWFYGNAYRKRRSLMASAMTHALVDTCWRTWFTLPLP